MKLLNKYEDLSEIQDYSGQDSIKDVEIVDLNNHIDESGSFMELMRLSEGTPENFTNYNLKQINYSTLDPNRIKAFHIHKKQTDIWFVPPGSKILLILTDLREDSETKKNIMRLTLGAGQTQLISIPPGIAHGCKNLQNQKGEIIYFINNKFNPDPEECDEWRLPWDMLGADIWEIGKE